MIRELGLDGAEINSGGFVPAPHLPIEAIRASQDARDDYLGQFAEAGVTLTALNCNGNPLHPDPAVRAKHGQDVVDAIELGALLGVTRLVTMPACPAPTPLPPCPRGPPCPHNLVYNPGTMERLATEINATHIGAELDPSHLFWQGIDPTAAVRSLGDLVFNAAAKDTRINPAALVNGVLDDRFGRVAADDPEALNLGGRYALSRWPENSSWDFVADGTLLEAAKAS